MNQEDIIRMAREAGMEQDGNNFFSPMSEEMDVHISDLERFFHAAYAAGAAAEREACATVCDEAAHDWHKHAKGGPVAVYNACAAAIRARNNT